MLDEFGIDSSRIIYVGKERREGRQYVAESTALIQHFFDLYPIFDDKHILTDNGSSFLHGLEDIGAKMHCRYTASVHQYLSPNDNRLHGEA